MMYEKCIVVHTGTTRELAKNGIDTNVTRAGLATDRWLINPSILKTNV